MMENDCDVVERVIPKKKIRHLQPGGVNSLA